MGEALRLVKNIIMVGVINSVNPSKGTVDVLFEDRDNLIVSDLPLLSFEYDMPEIGAQALCIFLGNGLEQGFCLKSFYSDILLPPVSDKNIFRKNFSDGTYIEYNKMSKEFQVVSENPLTIKGNFRVEGNIEATGIVTARNIGS